MATMMNESYAVEEGEEEEDNISYTSFKTISTVKTSDGEQTKCEEQCNTAFTSYQTISTVKTSDGEQTKCEEQCNTAFTSYQTISTVRACNEEDDTQAEDSTDSPSVSQSSLISTCRKGAKSPFYYSGLLSLMRRSLEMGSLSSNQQTNLGIMDDLHHRDHHAVDSNSLPYYNDISSSESESSSELMEDGSSAGSSSPTSPSWPKVEKGPLGDMSSLLQQLLVKRGLVRSPGYCCSPNATCGQDLANNKFTYCASYLCISKVTQRQKMYLLKTAYRSQPTLKTSASSKLISKKSSRGFRSSLGGKRNGGSLPSFVPVETKQV